MNEFRDHDAKAGTSRRHGFLEDRRLNQSGRADDGLS